MRPAIKLQGVYMAHGQITVNNAVRYQVTECRARFEDTHLDESVLQIIKEEIGESEESRAACLEELKNKLLEVKSLDACTEDGFLLAFLRVAKFDVSNAFQRVINYYTQHDKLTDAFQNVSMSLDKAKSPRHILASPYRLDNNSILLIGKGALDLTKTNILERFYLEVVIINSLIKNPLNQLYGITAIFDYGGFQYNAMLSYTPRMIHLLVNTLQNSLPLPVKACHIVNLPPLLSSVISIAFALLSKKIKNRIFIHPSNDGWQSLHKSLPPELLPEEYGGTLKESGLVDLSDHLDDLERELCERFKFGYLKSETQRELLRLNPPINGTKPEEGKN
ncbi:alpha-tocopherol transfer protein-like [Caerostris darwini]|uniref:Alpha-tocopherol transfer protein-like n=1 Tax=Caerostris darwini TaxID=1538125 RepID=A0AAV4QXD9_9ARAC|nr:alpha-tocopherol transfer protein-like [Caerostris darwini]